MQILINIYVNFTPLYYVYIMYNSYNRGPNTDFHSYNLKDKIPLAFVEIHLYLQLILDQYFSCSN